MVVMSANNIDLDSTMVIGEKFRFTGKVEGPTNVWFMLKETGDHTSFWLENNKMTFDAEKGSFKEAKITGSEVQREDDLLYSKINPIPQTRRLKQSFAYLSINLYFLYRLKTNLTLSYTLIVNNL